MKKIHYDQFPIEEFERKFINRKVKITYRESYQDDFPIINRIGEIIKISRSAESIINNIKKIYIASDCIFYVSDNECYKIHLNCVDNIEFL